MLGACGWGIQLQLYWSNLACLEMSKSLELLRMCKCYRMFGVLYSSCLKPIYSTFFMKILSTLLLVISLFLTSSAQNWTQISTGTSHPIYGNWWDATNQDFGVLTGWYYNAALDQIPFVLKTTNGGVTWSYQTPFLNGSYRGSRVAYFTSSSTGYLAGAGLAKTFDAGLSWSGFIDAAGVQFYDMLHTSASNGYLVGEEYGAPFTGVLYKTTDGWINWTPYTISTNQVSTITSLQRPSATRMYAGGNSYGSGDNSIFKSVDDGLTWSEVVFTEDVFSLAFISAATGYAGCPGGIWKTTDEGLTWNLVLSTTGAVHNIDIKNGQGFAVCADGRIYRTVDDGVSWTDMGKPIGTVVLNDVFVVSSSLAFAVGNGGVLLKYTPSLPLATVDFKARQYGPLAELTWKSLSDPSSSRFSVESSEDGLSWRTIGEVNGQDVDKVQGTYHLTDPHPKIGLNYYRLLGQEVDGKYNELGMQSLLFTAESGKWSISPNPVFTTTVVNGLVDSDELKVFDLLGVEHTAKMKRTGTSVSLDGLSPGVYVLLVQRNDTNLSLKLVKS
jgi:photosystem II stability/assembly factor-like uncharacterized protein